MYQLSLEINGNTLIMSYQQGYLISTVDGLTGVTSRLDTVQAASGIGDAYTGGTVQGLPITIRGKILDHNVTAKQALIDTAVPLGEGTLTVYNIDANRITPYRKIDVIVRVSPVITQEKHAKFTLSLYAPSPAWYSTDRQTISLENLQAASYTNSGHYASDYELRLNALDPVRQMSLYLDGITPNSKYLYIDFTKYNASGVSGIIRFGRERGKTFLTVGNTNVIQCLSAQSTLWALPAGEHTLTLSAGAALAGTVSFAEAFAGVVLSGI